MKADVSNIFKRLLYFTKFVKFIIVHEDESLFIKSRNDYNSTKISKFNLNVWMVNEYAQFVWGAHEIELTYSKVMKPTHMGE